MVNDSGLARLNRNAAPRVLSVECGVPGLRAKGCVPAARKIYALVHQYHLRVRTKIRADCDLDSVAGLHVAFCQRAIYGRARRRGRQTIIAITPICRHVKRNRSARRLRRRGRIGRGKGRSRCTCACWSVGELRCLCWRKGWKRRQCRHTCRRDARIFERADVAYCIGVIIAIYGARYAALVGGGTKRVAACIYRGTVRGKRERFRIAAIVL